MTEANHTTSTEFIETLALDLETHNNVKDGYSGNIFTGYFKAPASAKYRFYLSCDDECNLRLSTVNKDPSAATVIYRSDGWTSYRNYLAGGRKTTDWLTLTAGEYYYLEARHIQRFGGDHLTVSVEIDDSTITPGHHHTTKEVHRHEIRQTLTREMTNITIDNPDGGEFTLGILNPKTNTVWTSGKMNTNMSEGQVYEALKGYYASVFDAWIRVTRVMYMEDGVTTTTNVLLSKKTIYTVYVMRSLASPSTTKITITRISTASLITPSTPANTQLSNPPLFGLFRIKCLLEDGVTWNYTLDMNVTTAWPDLIRSRIVHACP